MNLSDFKKILSKIENLQFQLVDGTSIPPHFHVTEVGKTTKNYIDCGGKVREEVKINFQLWVADDMDHRLSPKLLLGIIAKSERHIGLEDAEIEVAYQGEKTIETYGLEFQNDKFVLKSKMTDCLAKDKCGIPS